MAIAENNHRWYKLPAALLIAVALMLAALGASEWLKPKRLMADELPPLDVKTLLPEQFAGWRVDRSGPPVIFDPTVEATLKQVYSQTLNVTYVNGRGQSMMLALAYGKNQNSWNTAAHRPEFCYRAQGYGVQERGRGRLDLGSHQIPVNRLAADRGGLNEPITYWVTLHDSAATPGISRKLQQIRYGLQGMLVDGFLVRISSFGPDESEQFNLQQEFMRDLQRAVAPDQRPRLFGRS
ncbi:MAG: exosortase-associated protein EpsI, B-type [Aquabacterium commune]|uniref:exosortase-associated protein EpsI, B-type n=1 Tax=Aquabacterium commune TaxID=70586 RepID=UPI003109FBE0